MEAAMDKIIRDANDRSEATVGSTVANTSAAELPTSRCH